tara:strand:+ start:407 stop:799 length:393 start_codon:yes stop_codon:yes gene_type:complete
MFEIIKNNKIENNIDNIFNSLFFNDYYQRDFNTFDTYYENNDSYFCIEIPLPGVSKKDINLSFNEGFIYLTYESSNDSNSARWNQSFNRRIKTPNNLILDKINASLKDGILKIKIDKDKSVSKKINIDIK